jgi:hypothetical protein
MPESVAIFIPAYNVEEMILYTSQFRSLSIKKVNILLKIFPMILSD